jgi:hypothetical protein
MTAGLEIERRNRRGRKRKINWTASRFLEAFQRAPGRKSLTESWHIEPEHVPVVRDEKEIDLGLLTFV